MLSGTPIPAAQAQPLAPAAPSGGRPNIVIIWGDGVGQSNVSAYSSGLMGYQTPNIDRLASEGVMFTDYYAEQRQGFSPFSDHVSARSVQRTLTYRGEAPWNGLRAKAVATTAFQ